ncbi:hypothetical protein [Comamonas sp. C11]|uniref:hypothetical protein n=1 Tax=Comamonas sp. C11 TaxID=2966554 RepID=UPI00211270CB|nr:hypothetical protein [Comamonas sp. C11]UUC94448.1 hypothetical protein NOX35_03680 [Comamonas sp. C11]
MESLKQALLLWLDALEQSIQCDPSRSEEVATGFASKITVPKDPLLTSCSGGSVVEQRLLPLPAALRSSSIEVNGRITNPSQSGGNFIFLTLTSGLQIQ